jgi:chitodextrinase
MNRVWSGFTLRGASRAMTAGLSVLVLRAAPLFTFLILAAGFPLAVKAADLRPPTVSITSPASGASVAGTITVTASAYDNRGVVGVQFKYNGINLDVEDTTAPYSVSADTTTVPNGSYTLTAIARDAAGNVASSAPVTITVANGVTADTQAPSVPTGLTGAAVSASQANLTWSASTDNVAVKGYYVYLNDVALATTTSTSFSHTGLTAGATYNYRVSAFDAVPNHSAWTAPVSVKTPVVDITPPAVSIISPASGATVSGTIAVTASATDNVGVAGIQFLYNGANLGVEDTTAPYSVSADTTTFLNGSHTLIAVARDAAGNVASSAPVTITVANGVDTQAPSVPTGLAGVAVSSTQVNLTWNASTDNVAVTGYYVYLNDVALATTTATSFQHTGLTAGATYNYRVSAFDAVPNHSAWTATPVAVTTPASASAARRLFASGFEGATTLVTPGQGNFWGTGGWTDITGTDDTTGFTWPPNIWGGGGGRFLFLTDPLVVSAADIGSYMFNRIETVTGPKGIQTRALYQEISRNVNGTEPMGTSPTTNLFNILPSGETSDLYVSYWVKLQPDLVEKMNNLPDGPGIVNGGTWRAFFAFKTGTQKAVTGPLNDPMDNGDYRVEVYVMTYGGGTPYWQVLADNNAGGGAPLVNNWSVQNRDVPVPIGEWFKFEIFWHRSDGADGRVWLAVNGNVICDRSGPNTGAWNLPINRISMPTVYTGSRMPVYQWIDDLEIWDGFPPVGPLN